MSFFQDLISGANFKPSQKHQTKAIVKMATEDRLEGEIDFFQATAVAENGAKTLKLPKEHNGRAGHPSSIMTKQEVSCLTCLMR